jgi:hypothetical protein
LAKTKPFGIAFTLYPAGLVKEVRPTLLAIGFAALFLLLILTVTPTIAGFQHRLHRS